MASLLAWRPVANAREFLFQPHDARELAIARVLVFSVLAYEAITVRAAWYSELPRGWTISLPGWNWMDQLDLVHPRVLLLCQCLLVAFAVGSVLGLFTRACTTAAAILAVYVLGVPNLFLKINHLDHLPVLLAIVMAASPCGDAWSADRLRKASDGGFSARYGVPLRMCWLLLATVYFFPGFWKLWNSAEAWFSGSALRSLLWDVQLPPDRVTPWLDVDRNAAWMIALGTATVIFELTFVMLLFHRASRWLALGSAYCFHIGVLLLTGINFYTLMWLLPILGDWSCLTRRSASASVIAAAFPSSAFFLGVSLIAAQIVVGFAKIDTWPIAVFPCFDYENRAATTTRAEVRLRQNGSTAPPSGDDVVLEKLNGGRYARLMDRMLRDAEQRRRYLDEYAAVLARAGFAVPKANLEIWEVVHHRDPARASENPVSERRLPVP